MKTRKNSGRSWLLAGAATAALAFWQLSPAIPVEASPPVDQQIQTVAGAPASFADVIEAVQPAVVGISVSGTLTQSRTPQNLPPGMPFGDFEDFLRRFFERQSAPDVPHGEEFQGMGSGFIVSADGYVVTNNHVVDHASKITVTLNDGRQLEGELIGTDPKTDLALIKVESDEPLPYASFGSSESTRVGDWVVAIGNPFGLGGSATAGIVSARGRDIQSGPYDDFIQIDAPINRGNSGGPLFDLSGKVIGVNTAIYSPNGGNVGIGFAIPAEMAESIVEQLRTHGRVERGWLGVSIQSVDEDMAEAFGLESDGGAIVASVVAGSPAEKAGLEPGDVILSVGGETVAELKDLTRKIADVKPGDSVEVELLRDGETRRMDVRIGENPSAAKATGREMREPAQGLGLSLAPVTPELRERFGIEPDVEGAVIAGVEPQGPAAKKGLRTGDVIVMVGQKAVTSVDEAIAAIGEAKKRDRGAVVLRVVRGGEGLFVAVPLA